MAVVPIFYYHSVGGEPPQTLARETFRLHLDAISRHGYQTVTVAQMLRGEFPPKSCVLTFDDGLLDNFQVVFPLLKEFEMVATFFVVPGFDDITRWVNPHTGQWSNVTKPGFTIAFENMRTEHRQILAAHGMEIGCHTFTHPKLTQISAQQRQRELQESRDHLESEIEQDVTSFCYPNGRFNWAVLKEVQAAGYAGACSTIPGYWNPGRYRYLLPRFLVEDPQYFEDVLLGRAFYPWSLLSLLFRRWRRD